LWELEFVTTVLTPVSEHQSEPRPRKWTRDEYDRLVEMGFFDGERIELIEGRIVQMSPQRVPHSVGVELMELYLRRAFATGHRVRAQLPFRSADGSEPEPDFAVIDGDDPRAAKAHPASAVLVVEIGDTTLEHDRHKARLYAASGVPEYWILNLVAGTLEVHRHPLPHGGSLAGPAYAEIRTLAAQDRIAPLAAANVDVAVADLLP
jgi:Uma2 family endonuclease